MNEKPKNKGGRPNKIDKIDMVLVEKLYKLGLDDKQVADCLSVTEQTINNWKKKYPKFFESLKDWKKIADLKVEKSLYQRACGYSHPETKVFCQDGVITEHTIIKHYPPDPTSMIFWLKNRLSDDWRDKQEHLHDIPEGLFDKLKLKNTDELIEELQKRGIVT